MSRYDFERLSNKMERAKPLTSLREPISEAYFPKMTSNVTNRAWPARSANIQLSDVNRQLDEIKVTIEQMETFVDRFKEACVKGYAKAVRQFYNSFSNIVEQCKGYFPFEYLLYSLMANKSNWTIITASICLET